MFHEVTSAKTLYAEGDALQPDAKLFHCISGKNAFTPKDRKEEYVQARLAELSLIFHS